MAPSPAYHPCFRHIRFKLFTCIFTHLICCIQPHPHTPHQTLIFAYMMHHLRTWCLYVAVWEVRPGSLKWYGLMHPGSWLCTWADSLVALSGDSLYVSRYSPVPLNHLWFAFYTFIVCMGTLIITLLIIIIYQRS